MKQSGQSFGLRPIDYKSALEVQNAVNLSGVVRTFSEITSRIWHEARQKGKGTDWVNQHPICVLFSSKISSLAGSEQPVKFGSSYEKCNLGAEGREVNYG